MRRQVLATARATLPLLALALPAFPTSAIAAIYYDDFANKSCNSAECIVAFTKIQAGPVLIIDRLSCAVQVGSPAVLKSAGLAFIKGGGISLNNVQLPYVREDGPAGSKHYHLSLTSKFRLSDARPAIVLVTTESTNIEADCQISGTVTTLP
jgi:hypothetical protein